jgi:hypothetical protein
VYDEGGREGLEAHDAFKNVDFKGILRSLFGGGEFEDIFGDVCELPLVRQAMQQGGDGEGGRGEEESENEEMDEAERRDRRERAEAGRKRRREEEAADKELSERERKAPSPPPPPCPLYQLDTSRPSPRTKRTRLVLPPVLSGHERERKAQLRRTASPRAAATPRAPALRRLTGQARGGCSCVRCLT